MAQPKDKEKETVQKRLARLGSTARPISEKDASTSESSKSTATTCMQKQITTSLVTPFYTRQDTSQSVEHIAKQSPRSVGQLTERVRGRWTPEQKTFITKYARERRARAAEVLRYIVAWFLNEGAPEHPASREPLAPSPFELVKRETGLELLDFMTTKDQAEAIVYAAGDGGQAAFLRTAVDAFRTRGPGATSQQSEALNI